MNDQFSSLDEFWPFYVSQHLNRVNRRLHFAGTTLALGVATLGAALRSPWIFAAAPVMAYGLAWVGHFFYERNRPATFVYPLLSLRADFRMYRMTWMGTMDTEILLLTQKIRQYRASAL